MWINSFKEPFYIDGDNAKFYLEILQSSVSHAIEFVEDIHEGDEYSERTGCIIFDNASLAQKVFLLNFTLENLLSPTSPPPTITHILEAAAYFPMAYLEVEIELEIELELNTKSDETNNYKDEYFWITYFRRKTYEFYKSNILSLDIAHDIVDPSDSEYKTLEEWQNYYKDKLKFNPDSTNMQEWSNIISDIAHDLVLGDDEDFQISSIKPQVVDGNTWIENAMGISEEYFSNRLPKVTQEEYEKSIQKIFSYQIK